MPRGNVHMPRCTLAGVEATVAATAHAFPRHSHDRFGIGVIVSGGHRSASGRGVVEARASDAIMVNPGEVHDGSPLDERGRAWRMLYLEPALLEETAAELFDITRREIELTQPVARDLRLNQLFDRLFAVAVEWPASIHGAAHAPDNLLHDEALLDLLGYFLRTHATAPSKARAAKATPDATSQRHAHSAVIARARMRIDDDPAAPLTLADLAADANISRFQLLRSFAQQTGLPPHAYRMQRRVALARQFIARGAALADAAVQAGFADQSHMTRAFVRLLGVTPANYAAAVR